jgi:hypothetical protein
LADAANVSQEGKLNILGTFANINAHEFPARHPEMQLVLRLEASPAEAGMKKKLEVKVLDEDGRQVGGVSGDFNVPSPPSPGRRICIQTALRIVDAVFPKEGNYEFDVLINDDLKAEVPLSLTLVKKEGQENGD